MNRALLLAGLLVTAAVVMAPTAVAKPPDCVYWGPSNFPQVEPGPCEGTQRYVCEMVIERLIPYNCE